MAFKNKPFIKLKIEDSAGSRPLTLYFGCRHSNGDFIFKQEIEDYLNRGILSKLHTAFSRDKVNRFFKFAVPMLNRFKLIRTKKSMYRT